MSASSCRRRVRLVVLTALLVLATAVPAAADDHKQLRKSVAGMRIARAVALKRSDIPPGTGWTGHTTSPTVSPGQGCGSYHPRQSDLVVIGDIDAEWSHAELHLDSEVQVLQTPRMVRLDWQRTVASPRFLACARKAAAGAADPSWSLVSVRKLSFPTVATYVAAFRTTFDIEHADGSPERLIMDVVFFGKARTEVTLTSAAAISHAPQLRQIEFALARRLAARIPA